MQTAKAISRISGKRKAVRLNRINGLLSLTESSYRVAGYEIRQKEKKRRNTKQSINCVEVASTNEIPSKKQLWLSKKEGAWLGGIEAPEPQTQPAVKLAEAIGKSTCDWGCRARG